MNNDAQANHVLAYRVPDESPAFANRRNVALIAVSISAAAQLLFVVLLRFDMRIRYSLLAVVASFVAVFFAFFFGTEMKRSHPRTIILVLASLELVSSILLIFLLVCAWTFKDILSNISID